MDGLIRTAWRAFWVGLGASAVLIGQSVVAPGPSTTPADPAAAPVVVPAPWLAPAAPAAARAPSSKSSPVTLRCATVANVLRCS